MHSIYTRSNIGTLENHRSVHLADLLIRVEVVNKCKPQAGYQLAIKVPAKDMFPL